MSAVLVLAMGAGIYWWLRHQAEGLSDLERVKAQAEALKIGLTAIGGTGAALALLLAFRRQRSAEAAQEETQHDATERRVTELYTKAVEQLGSSKAAVRLGGLYALERLAQNTPDQRTTVMEVFCAYLRMPYLTTSESIIEGGVLPKDEASVSAEPVGSTVVKGSAEEDVDPYIEKEERQVRLAAQRILASHLRPLDTPHDAVGNAANAKYWPGLDLDLTGATLVNFDLSNCQLRNVDLSSTRFIGSANFSSCKFDGDAHFLNATFTRDVKFKKAKFGGRAFFMSVTFGEFSDFLDVKFRKEVSFFEADFGGIAYFHGARFKGKSFFTSAIFAKEANFLRAIFTRRAEFIEARFQNVATFTSCVFGGAAVFFGTHFESKSAFDAAEFGSDAIFSKVWFQASLDASHAEFSGDSLFRSAQFWQSANFVRVNFRGDADFDSAVFLGASNFGKISFSGSVRFMSTRFVGPLQGLDSEEAEFSNALVNLEFMAGRSFWWPESFALVGDRSIGDSWGKLVRVVG